jgi:putative ABC transport system permease protein
MEVPFDLESSPPRSQGERPGVGYISITSDYLRTLHIPIKRGRAFTDRDDAVAPPVVLVNEAFVHLYFPNEDPIGKRILLNRPILGKSAFEDTIRPEIVGVIGNVKQADLGAQTEPYVYAPHVQNPWSAIVFIVLRSAINPASLGDSVRRELMQLDKEQPIDQLGSMEQNFATRFAEPRFQAEIMAGFALLALTLAIVGIYGVNSYAVAQRRHEIGLRIALGATPGAVLSQILMESMRSTGLGIAIGLAGAIAVGSALRGVLVGVSATDPLTLLGVSVLLAVVGAAACYIPARRATRIDPAISLRQQ